MGHAPYEQALEQEIAKKDEIIKDILSLHDREREIETLIFKNEFGVGVLTNTENLVEELEEIRTKLNTYKENI